MKHYLRNGRGLSTLVLLYFLLSATHLWADTETATFNKNVGLPDGWTIVGDITNDDTRGRNNTWGLWTYAKSSTDNYVVTQKITGSIEFYARAYNKNTASEVVVYEYTGSGLGEQLFTTGSLRSSQTPTWSKFALTVSGNRQVAIALNYAAIDDVTYTTAAADEEGPALAITDGNNTVEDGYTCELGLQEAGATHEFTLYNPGSESITLNISSSGNFTVSPTEVTIAPKETKPLTVTVPAATASGTITVTPTVDAVAAITLNISVFVKDPEKLFIDFDENPLPDTWTMGSGWSVADGMAVNNGIASNIVSGKLTVDDGGEQVFFNYRGRNSWGEEYDYVKVYYATNGNDADADWTLIDGATLGCTNDSTWRQAVVNVPAMARYLCLQGRYVCIDNYYGLSLPKEPLMVVTAEERDLGVIDADSSFMFNIKNTGHAPLTGIGVTSSNAAFTVSGIPAKLPAGADTDVMVTMSAAKAGMFRGTITVSADGFTGEQAATFNVCGAVMTANAPKVDFDNNEVPAYWTNNGMAIEGGALTGSRTTYNMTSPKLAFGSDTFFMVKAKALEQWGTIKIEQSTDNGESWSELMEKDTDSGLEKDNYKKFAVSISKAVNRLRFTAYESAIDEIAGLTADGEDPLFAMYATDEQGSLTGSPLNGDQTVDFGDGITETKTVTYIVRNDRLGTMKVAARVAADAKGITVSIDRETVGTGEQAVVTIALNYDADAIGTKGGMVTITGSNNADETISSVTVSVSGHTRQPGKIFVTFDDGVPTGWTQGNWEQKVTDDGDGYMAAGATATRMVTSKVSVENGEKLYITALGQLLNVYYSASKNGFKDTNKLSVPLTNAYEEVEVTGIPANTKYLAFEGQNAYITTVYGFTPDTSDPQLEVWIADNKATTGTATLDYGMIQTATTKELTIKNANTGTLVVTAITLPEGFVLNNLQAPSEESPLLIAAGESQPVAVTLTTTATGELQGNIVVKANDQPDFTMSVKGYVMDLTKMLANFDDNQLPTGWKNGTGGAPWLFADGMAYGEYADYKDARMQTPRLTVGSDDKMVLLLKGNAKFAELKVEVYEPLGTTPVQTFNFDEQAQQSFLSGEPLMVTVSGLQPGDYRLVFDGYKTYIDNVNGFTVNTNGPVLGVYDDELASHEVTSPQTFDFGTQAANTTVSYYLKNKGTGTLTVTAVTVADGSVGIAATMNGETTLSDPSGHLTLDITMSAATEGEKSGTVTVETNAGTFVISVSGNVKYPRPLMVISETDAADHDFGTVAEEASYTITINNEGDADLTGVKAELAKGAESDYTVALAAGGTSGNLIAAGGSGTVTVTQKYDAMKTGTHSDVLTITADNTDTRFVIRLSGETLPPIALGDYMLPETEQIPGTEYQATVSVANRHTDENVTTQLLFIDEQQTATIIAKAERVMARNTTETFTLTGNTPLAEGTYQVYIKVTAAGITLETARRSMTLKHIRAMEVTDSAGIAVSSGHKVDFGTVADSVSKSFIITNTGTADMTVSSLTAPDGFTVTPALTDDGVVLAAGEKMKLLITMNPALASGELAGDVVIGYSLDGSTDSSFLLSVSGTALNPEKVGVMLDDMAGRNAGRPVYNLRGERTTQLRKGHVYIQNGKTFIHR